MDKLIWSEMILHIETTYDDATSKKIKSSLNRKVYKFCKYIPIPGLDTKRNFLVVHQIPIDDKTVFCVTYYKINALYIESTVRWQTVNV